MQDTGGFDRNMSILVVDDFSTMRRIVKSALGTIGLTNVTEAENGTVALQKLKSGNFQFIVSDWNMPEMMGIDLLRAVRADEKLKKTHFLMITAEAQKDNIIEAAKAGVSNYLVKPFTADTLRQKIEAIFKVKL